MSHCAQFVNFELRIDDVVGARGRRTACTRGERPAPLWIASWNVDAVEADAGYVVREAKVAVGHLDDRCLADRPQEPPRMPTFETLPIAMYLPSTFCKTMSVALGTAPQAPGWMKAVSTFTS